MKSWGGAHVEGKGTVYGSFFFFGNKPTRNGWFDRTSGATKHGMGGIANPCTSAFSFETAIANKPKARTAAGVFSTNL